MSISKCKLTIEFLRQSLFLESIQSKLSNIKSNKLNLKLIIEILEDITKIKRKLEKINSVMMKVIYKLK